MDNNEYQIITQKSALTPLNQITIKLNKHVNSLFLLNSIKKINILKQCYIDGNNISFYANKIQTFTDWIQYKHVLECDLIFNIILSLTMQLKSLINDKVCFYKYDINNMFVIDNTTFIYVSLSDLLNINNEQTIIISTPFLKNNVNLLSPELLLINNIPSNIHYKSIYWSLGMLIIHCICNMHNNNNNNNNNNLLNLSTINTIKTQQEIHKILNQELYFIKETKLFYFLERCMAINANERKIVYL